MPEALILFGDGMQALYYDERHLTTNRDGIKIVPMLVVPSIELRNKYGLTEDDLTIITDDGRRGIWMEYPWKHIDWLNRTKTGAVIFVWCSFNGSETAIMRKTDELLDWSKTCDKTENLLRAQVSYLLIELQSAVAVQAELMRKMKEFGDLKEKVEENTGTGG